MAVSILTNFSYSGAHPNFARDKVAKLEDLAAVNPSDKHYDYGHIVFCEEDGKHYKYIYDYNNPPSDAERNETTGWFSLLITGSGDVSPEIQSQVNTNTANISKNTTAITTEKNRAQGVESSLSNNLNSTNTVRFHGFVDNVTDSGEAPAVDLEVVVFDTTKKAFLGKVGNTYYSVFTYGYNYLQYGYINKGKAAPPSGDSGSSGTEVSYPIPYASKVYIYAEKLYIWNGNDLVAVTSESSGGVDEDIIAQIELNKTNIANEITRATERENELEAQVEDNTNNIAIISNNVDTLHSPNPTEISFSRFVNGVAYNSDAFSNTIVEVVFDRTHKKFLGVDQLLGNYYASFSMGKNSSNYSDANGNPLTNRIFINEGKRYIFNGTELKEVASNSDGINEATKDYVDNAIDSAKILFEAQNWIPNQYILSSNGKLSGTSNPSSVTGFIDLNNALLIEVRGRNAGGQVASVAFYDENEVCISTIASREAILRISDIPNNAKYVRATGKNDGNDRLVGYADSEHIAAQIKQNKTRIDSVDSLTTVLKGDANALSLAVSFSGFVFGVTYNSDAGSIEMTKVVFDRKEKKFLGYNSTEKKYYLKFSYGAFNSASYTDDNGNPLTDRVFTYEGKRYVFDGNDLVVVSDIEHLINAAVERGRTLAKRDLYIAAGAKYNDTDTVKEETSPWGETVQHLPGHYYLNGLGDITETQMMKIYQRGYFNESETAPLGYSNCWGNKIRTNLCRIGMWNASLPKYMGADNKLIESVNLHVTSSQNVTSTCNITFSDSESIFNGSSKLSFIDTRCLLKCTSWKETAFSGCTSLKELRISTLQSNISFKDSPNLSKKSIIYMIQNAISSLNKAITITLNHDAYARISEDTEVIEALNTKNTALSTGGSISIVCATHSDEVIS
jgi:hypothetical protein